MDKKVNIGDLISSVAQEVEQKKLEKTAAPLSSLVTGSKKVEEEKTIEKIAEEVGNETGAENISLSADLEKFASELSDAHTSDDIIKIAENIGNSDLSSLSKVASKVVDVILEELEEKLK